MYQRILVPIDGSDTSQRALQEAIKVGNRESQLRLVYVLEENYLLDAEGFAYIDLVDLQKAVRLTGERTLALAADKVKQSGTKVETVLLEAKGERIANVIENEAKHWQANLIVIGTHGRSGINRMLLGSVAEGVVRVSSVPVLLVRAE